jgi:hypothetical protein
VYAPLCPSSAKDIRDGVDPEELAAPSEMTLWCPLSTVFFTLAVAVVFILVQTAVAIPYLIIKLVGTLHPDSRAAASALESDGLFLGISEAVAGSAAIGFTLLLAWVRKGPRVRDYLALRSVPRPTMLPCRRGPSGAFRCSF